MPLSRIRRDQPVCYHLPFSPRFVLMSGLLLGSEISDGTPMPSIILRDAAAAPTSPYFLHVLRPFVSVGFCTWVISAQLSPAFSAVYCPRNESGVIFMLFCNAKAISSDICAKTSHTETAFPIYRVNIYSCRSATWIHSPLAY